MQPLDGSKGRQLTKFTSEHIYDFHWSLDGKQLALGYSNGTWFQGKRIERHELRDGDEVLFGDTAVRVEFR